MGGGDLSPPWSGGVFLESVRVEGDGRIRPLALRTDRPAADTPDASIAPSDSTVPLADQKSNYLDDVAPVTFQSQAR